MLSDLLFRLRALFRRGAMEVEMNEELRSHFENHVDKLVASGMPREKAQRRARLEFGGHEQLRTRLTLLGIGLGIVAALIVTRLMATLLYGISATDPLTFTSVALLLALVALAAC